jgi:hypothetical protein
VKSVAKRYLQVKIAVGSDHRSVKMKHFFPAIIILLMGSGFCSYASELRVIGALGKFDDEFISCSSPVEYSAMGAKYTHDISSNVSSHFLLFQDDIVEDDDHRKILRGCAVGTVHMRLIHFGVGINMRWLISSNSDYDAPPLHYPLPTAWVGIGPKRFYAYAGVFRQDLLYSVPEGALFSIGVEARHSRAECGLYLAALLGTGFCGAYFEPRILPSLSLRADGYLATGGGGGGLSLAWKMGRNFKDQ